MADSENVTTTDLELGMNLALAKPMQDPTPNTSREPIEDETHEKSAIGVNMYDDNDSQEEAIQDGIGEKKAEGVDDKKESEKPLLEDSVKIDIAQPDNEGEDTATLPLRKKSKLEAEFEVPEKEQTAKLPVYLFPISRIKDAWNNSDNILQFFCAAVCIIFQTVGWFTCVGGVPFVSLVMLIIGIIYVDDCNIQPNIPVYLIVSGVLGTIQHVLTIWTKYVPKESQGRLKVTRSYCRSINGLFHLFLMIWFIIGCVWIYGAYSDVVFRDRERDVYCNETLYYFAFWIMNLSFILLGMLIVLSLCFLLCVIATPKNEEKGIVQ